MKWRRFLNISLSLEHCRKILLNRIRGRSSQVFYFTVHHWRNMKFVQILNNSNSQRNSFFLWSIVAKSYWTESGVVLHRFSISLSTIDGIWNSYKFLTIRTVNEILFFYWFVKFFWTWLQWLLSVELYTLVLILSCIRNNYRCFKKKDVLKEFWKVLGKHLW